VIDPLTYYGDTRIADAVTRECRHRLVMVRTANAIVRHYHADAARRLADWSISRWPSSHNDRTDPFIEIHRPAGPGDPTSLEYHVRAGVIEFVPEVSKVWDLERAPTFCVDLDPKFDIAPSLLIECMRMLADRLKPGTVLHSRSVIDRKFRFSGNRSLHMWVALDLPAKLDTIRAAVKERLEPVIKSTKLMTLDLTRQGNVVYVDLGTIAKSKCVRALYSLHAKTGLCCVPLDNLEQFDRSQADPAVVLRDGPRTERF
jgi:DNA primase